MALSLLLKAQFIIFFPSCFREGSEKPHRCQIHTYSRFLFQETFFFYSILTLIIFHGTFTPPTNKYAHNSLCVSSIHTDLHKQFSFSGIQVKTYWSPAPPAEHSCNNRSLNQLLLLLRIATTTPFCNGRITTDNAFLLL